MGRTGDALVDCGLSLRHCGGAPVVQSQKLGSTCSNCPSGRAIRLGTSGRTSSATRCVFDYGETSRTQPKSAPTTSHVRTVHAMFQGGGCLILQFGKPVVGGVIDGVEHGSWRAVNRDLRGACGKVFALDEVTCAGGKRSCTDFWLPSRSWKQFPHDAAPGVCPVTHPWRHAD